MEWEKMLQENVTTVQQLTGFFHMTHDDQRKMSEILCQYPMSIPSYYLSLIHPDHPDDPVKKMCIPSLHETDLEGAFDTSGEADNTVIEGMQHKYSQTALILSTNQCAMYCRHCFRKRLVGLSEGEILKQLDQVLGYIRAHTEITNVLISGGDAFMNSNKLLRRYLESLTTIPHLTYIRFGTRIPVVLPQRITEDAGLQALLKEYAPKKQLYVVTQFNHPNEFTIESTKALQCLIALGIPVRNQTVLLRGVNDSADILTELFKGLAARGVAPYYVFQCRPVIGVKNQFQVPLVQGIRIIEDAKRNLSGFAKGFRYAMSHPTGKIEIVGTMENGDLVLKYHQAKEPQDCGRVFTLQPKEGQCWLDYSNLKHD